jgi:hypothetical protein
MSEEKRWEEEKSKMATHKADIRQRLDTLNASFIYKFEYSLVDIPSSFPFLSFIFICFSFRCSRVNRAFLGAE